MLALARLHLRKIWVFFSIAYFMSFSVDGQEHLMRDSVFYPIPDAVSDAPYSVSVGGATIPVEQGTRQDVTYYARFRFTQPVEVTVNYIAESERAVALLPDRYCDDLQVERQRLVITIDDTRPRILRVDGLPYLFLFPEPREIDASASSIVSIAPDLDAERHTQALQSAIDDASQSEGGTIVLASGIHRSKALHLKSHTTLYLKAGAVLQGTGVSDDYVNRSGRRALILADHAVDAAIVGRGVIDGMGCVVQREYKTKAHLIDALECRNLTLEGVVLRDPGSWTVHLIGCEDVRVSGIKILGDRTLANTDGLDPDMSRNVVIEDCFIYSGDDAVVVKTTGTLGVEGISQNVVARRCVLMTKKTALKIGTESRYDIRDVLFEDIDVVDSARGCALWMRDGATYSNITFRDIRMPNLMRFPNENWSGEAYRVSIQERHGRGRMENILFERVRARSEQRSILLSRLEYPVEGIAFKDCVWWANEGESISPVELNNAENIRFINCTIEIAGDVQAFPDSLLTGSSRTAVQLE